MPKKTDKQSMREEDRQYVWCLNTVVKNTEEIHQVFKECAPQLRMAGNFYLFGKSLQNSFIICWKGNSSKRFWIRRSPLK